MTQRFCPLGIVVTQWRFAGTRPVMLCWMRCMQVFKHSTSKQFAQCRHKFCFTAMQVGSHQVYLQGRFHVHIWRYDVQVRGL
jgi:hypothetical protein